MARERFPRKWAWPDDARIAFSVGIPFEAFEFASQVNLTGRRGEKDSFSLSYGDYAWKAGIWRLLTIVDEYGIKVSVSANGLMAEGHPDIIKLLSDEGHEINGHGWANDLRARDGGRESELDDIKRCTEVLTRTTGGVRPVGWTSPGSSGSDDTAELLASQGYLWLGDDASDDLPFLQKTSAGPIVILPRTNMYTNDIVVWIIPQNGTGVFVENFKNAFDQLYREGEEGYPKWLSITVHAQMGGRPVFSNALRKCLEYVTSHSGVYYARNRDVASWAMSRL